MLRAPGTPCSTVQRVPHTESVSPPTARPGDALAPAAPARGGLRGLLSRHLGPGLKFLVVGGTVFLIDAAVYNLLVFWTPAHGWGHGLLFETPLLAKVLSIAFASVLTYLGNRLWTFSDRTVPHTARSVAVFIAINVIASLLQLGCLAFSRYVLDLHSPLADNISGNLIGQAVSTAFRYVTYGRFVFPQRADPTSEDEA